MDTPYLVINSGVTPFLQRVEGFKLDLGKNAINQRSQFTAFDPYLATHMKMGGSIIHKLAQLGQIPVYVDESLGNLEMFLFFDGKSSYRKPEAAELHGDIHAYLESMLEDLFGPDNKEQ